jgi:phosphoribosylformylglycinamidine synthase subunit PurS
MSLWLAKIQVTLKPVVNDPEGLSIAQALHHLGFNGVSSVRAGKYFEVEIAAETKEAATESAESMCRRLLSNPVIEEYRFTLARRSARRSPV